MCRLFNVVRHALKLGSKEYWVVFAQERIGCKAKVFLLNGVWFNNVKRVTYKNESHLKLLFVFMNDT